MIDIAWLGAALAPTFMRAHPNFSGFSSQYSAFAGMLVSHAVYERDAALDDIPPNVQRLIASCRGSFSWQRQESGVEGLRALSEELSKSDLALACVSALMSCVGAVELDDYRTSIDFISRRVADMELAIELDSSNMNAVLLLATLYQQRAFLRYLSEHEGLTDANNAIDQLNTFDVSRASIFETSTGTDKTSEYVLSEIAVSLEHASRSLRTILTFPEDDLDGFALVQKGYPQLLSKLELSVGEAYDRLELRRFRSEAGDSSQYFNQTPVDDGLFEAVVALQLFGHPQTKRMRVKLGMVRWLESRDGQIMDVDGFQDQLRSVRQGRDVKTLRLVAQNLSSRGPLIALMNEAVHVAKRVEFLGSEELAVLRQAADLLDDTTLQFSLGRVLALIDGPYLLPDGPWKSGHGWRFDVWDCALQLARSDGQRANVLSSVLRWITTSQSDSGILDQQLAGLIASVATDFGSITDVSRWREWLSAVREGWPQLGIAVRANLSLSSRQTRGRADELDLDAVTDLVNLAISRDAAPLMAVCIEAAEVLATALWDLVLARDSGTFPRPNTLEVAVAFEILVNDESLWSQIWSILLDSSFSREETGPVFDRLARGKISPVPREVRDAFAENVSERLHWQPKFAMFKTTIFPYPELLRFLGNEGLIDSAQLHASVTELSSSEDLTARREGAKTLASLSRAGIIREWTVALCLSLSRDADPVVVGHAMFALVLMDEFQGTEFREIIRGRILAGLSADGTVIPRFTISGMVQSSRSLGRLVEDRVESLSRNHPSRWVREDARTFSDKRQ